MDEAGKMEHQGMDVPRKQTFWSTQKTNGSSNPTDHIWVHFQTPRIINYLWHECAQGMLDKLGGVWKCGKIQPQLFDISFQKYII